MNNLVGLLSYMVAGKKVDQVNSVNLALQYIVIHTSCTFADAVSKNGIEQRCVRMTQCKACLSVGKNL